MKIQFLGGAGEVGRSAILVNEDMLLDYGLKLNDSMEYPQNCGMPKSLIITHGHLDHCGIVPNLFDIVPSDIRPEVYATPTTAGLTELLAKDTLEIAENSKNHSPFDVGDIKKFERAVKRVNYGESFETNGYSVSLFDAGHIPGSSMVHLEKNNQSLFYTGDINSIQTELQNGAKMDGQPEADVLIVESTYFGKDHPPRKDVEQQFIDSLHETLDNGGCALVPAFAIGRTQEILLTLDKYELRANVDGMGVDVYNLMMKSPESLRNPDKLEAAFEHAHIVKPQERKEIMREPSIIVTTAGMLNGGPVMGYIPQIYDDPNSKIHLTGYQAEKTNGRFLLETKSIIVEYHGDTQKIDLACGVENFNFSAHSGDTQLKELVKTFCDNGTGMVIPVHGDNTQEFAGWIEEELGVDSVAPINGQTIKCN